MDGNVGTAPFQKERPTRRDPTPREKGGKQVTGVYLKNPVWGITPTCTCVQTHCHAEHECVSYLRYLKAWGRVTCSGSRPPDPK